MKKLDYGKYMEGEISFLTKADEQVCLQCWNEGIEMSVDEYGRVFNEADIWIANVKMEDKR